MAGLEILNVGEGDIKLSFDKDNPAERIRAARIVKDMLRRGYALLVEVDPGSGSYVACKEFDEETCEYIIADMDPLAAERADEQETEAKAKTAPKEKRKPGRPSRKVPADGTRAVAVSKTAGG